MIPVASDDTPRNGLPMPRASCRLRSPPKARRECEPPTVHSTQQTVTNSDRPSLPRLHVEMRTARLTNAALIETCKRPCTKNVRPRMPLAPSVQSRTMTSWSTITGRIRPVGPDHQTEKRLATPILRAVASSPRRRSLVPHDERPQFRQKSKSERELKRDSRRRPTWIERDDTENHHQAR